MALLIPFCNLISIFLSISNTEEAEQRLLNEIFGCVTYLKLPYETVMSMPVYLRKYWILKHNEDVENAEREAMQSQNKSNGTTQITGGALNSYANIAQKGI